MAKLIKDKLDKFYTKSVIVDLCLLNIDLKNYKTIIEPSAGDGSFSNKIKGSISYDIEPGHDGIIKQDFLKLDPFFLLNLKKPILTIGNPPFGNQSSLAIKFIKKASQYSDTIAFILPKSFKKVSMIEKIPEYFHVYKCIDLPENSFNLNGDDYNVPCVFLILNKMLEKRPKENKLKPKSFSFVKKDENPDLSFRRVGVNAGFVSFDLNKSDQSHYFLKTKEPEKLKILIENIRWVFDNTAGPKSISKQELIKEIENCF